MDREAKLELIKEMRQNIVNELDGLYGCTDTRNEMYYASKLTAYATIMTAFLADL